MSQKDYIKVKEQPPGQNKVEQILYEINNKKTDFRNRGAYLYKHHWVRNQLNQQDSSDQTIVDDPDIILNSHVQDALEKASQNAKSRSRQPLINRSHKNVIATSSSIQARRISRGQIVVSKNHTMMSKTANPSVDRAKFYLTSDKFRNVVLDNKSRVQFSEYNNYWPTVVYPHVTTY